MYKNKQHLPSFSDLLDVQAGFKKGRGPRDWIANIHWFIEKSREFQKNTYLWFIDYVKDFNRVDHNKLLKILKEMGIPFKSIKWYKTLTNWNIKWYNYLNRCRESFWQNSTSMYDKNTPESRHRSNMWKVKVTQLCLTFCDPMDDTVHGILQARILEWIAFPFSRWSSQQKDQT